MLITLRLPEHPIAEAHLPLFGGRPVRSKRRKGSLWVELDIPNGKPALDHALEGLVQVNQALMGAWELRGFRVPSVYEAAERWGLKYVPEPRGREWWQTFVDNLKELEGDCEDLGCHQAAWWRHTRNHPARGAAIRSGRLLWHCITEHPDGTIEDPSMPLGLDEYRRRRLHP